MPGMDGLELCRRIRAQGGDTYTYVILLTALSDKAHLLTAIQAGADEYLTKPVDRDELQVRLISAARVTSLHRQLAAQKAALEAKTRDQEAFVYSVAHDLRAPLVSLQGLASMLIEDYGQQLDDNARLYVERISVNAHKLHALVNDLLQLLKVGQAQVEYTPVDLGAVVGQVIEQLNHTLHARAAEVQVHGALPIVYSNHAQMVQLFTNLIDNGVKYTPLDRTPTVAIEAHDHDDAWHLTVSDTGVGIPPALQPKIFGIFQRLPSGKALNPDGTGVGLAIVARIVEAHRGKLWIESEEGAGTTFHVTLPKREALEDSDQRCIFAAHAPNNAA
jgi:signal transduction histidine kinase